MVLFDTNMILRYLLNDNAEMAAEAERYIVQSEACVTVEVIAEAVYVLSGVYSIQRDDIADTLKEFLKLVYCNEMEVLNFALDAYAARNLDFIDCVLYAYHAVKGTEVATFDKKLKKLVSAGR